MHHALMKTLRLAGVLAAFALPLAGCATEGKAPVEGQPSIQYQEVTPQPEGQRWTDLLHALGQPALNPGERAYRKSWESNYGVSYVDLLERADGSAVARWSNDGALVELEPDDLDAFHALFDPLQFLTMSYRDPGATCLDECAEIFFEMESDQGYRQVHVDPYQTTVDQAAYELQQIIGARARESLFVPRPWWTPDGEARPPARPWLAAQRLPELNFADHSDKSFNRAWRLVRFPVGGDPVVLTVTLQRGPRQGECGPHQGRRIRNAVFCDPDSPDEIAVWSSETGETRRWDVRDRGEMEPFEAALTKAGFATMDAESSACAETSGETWALEVFAYRRYRHVRGGACDGRGLTEALAAMEALAEARR